MKKPPICCSFVALYVVEIKLNRPPYPVIGQLLFCCGAKGPFRCCVFAGTVSDHVRKVRDLMKKFLKTLVLGLLTVAMVCCMLPAAFAADEKESSTFTIGLDAMGGSSSVVAVTTNLSGKLNTLPEQPTLEGYTFDGWYTEPVGGTKVSTSTVFTGDTTVYAHWAVKAEAASSSSAASSVASTAQQEQSTDLGDFAGVFAVAGALLTTMLLSMAF